MKYDLTAINIIPKRLVSPESWVKHLPFAYYLMQHVRPGVLVELGVHTGNSFCAFAEAARIFNIDTKFYGVDTFEGEKHAGFYDTSVYDELSHYTKLNFNESVSLLKMRFEEAVHYFTDKSIDVLHIDGLHTYEAVKSDFDTWLPKMKPNGIILFHDTLVRRDEFGVWKLWSEIKDNYYHSYEFSFGHGLGVLFLGEIPFADHLKELDRDLNIQNLFLPAGERNEWHFQFKRCDILYKDLKREHEQLRDVEHVEVRAQRDEAQAVIKELRSRISFKIYYIPFIISAKVKKFFGLK
ncbi:putative glycosyltransferase [Leptospira ryugenii]|uniref:Putative glycosyltransferase n=1 Tax=Leptospira ryugenii TaxID=1917863 RepID=A0A2P2DW50_9LEPT|nr:class I SAM-dependent methyltransferase [Leptospira ryugenii]GBF48790.1 putative glycosyltransferase [Leptospira ryugenii]